MMIEKMELPEDLKAALGKFFDGEIAKEEKEEPFKAFVPVTTARTMNKDTDDAEGVELTVELPGVEECDLSVKIIDRCVVIDAKGIYKNYKFKSTPLPKEIDEKNSDADYEDGLLTVYIYKKKVESFDVPVN
jgi:HSP20 family molecular chaperone IbpA